MDNSGCRKLRVETKEVPRVLNLKIDLRSWTTALVAGLVLGGSAIAEPITTTYSTVDLVAEHASLPADGGTVTLGLYLEPNPGWHAYWLNPGDAGLAPRMRWDLSEGFEAAPFDFPVPHILPFIDLITYAYEESILLLSDVTVPAGLSPGESVQLQGRASWVVCDDELCVPENTTLSLTLPVGDGGPDAAQAGRFAAARARLPEPVEWPAQFERLDGTVRVAIETPEAASDATDPYLYVSERYLVEYGQQSISFTPRGAVVSMDAARRQTEATSFSALLTFTDGAGDERAFSFDVQEGTGVAGSVLGGSGGSLTPAAQSYTGLSFGLALLFAFIGGVVLNLMPCVFPILSMKALSLVKLSHTDQRVAAQSGLLYTAGILVAFALIGGALIALREAGQAVGWGFQLQSPVVNLTLGLLMLGIALNLFGVFEVGTRVMGAGQALTAGGERRAAFFTGLLAVVVATPCTAPFMAGALGYALVQPAAVALSVFLSLGLGLAFPYLLLSYVPAAGRVLPKPGPWMATFKHVLAFPMLATAVWLFWVIGKQLGVDSMTVGLLAALCFAFAVWAYGRVAHARRPYAWRAAAALGLIGAVFIGLRIENYRAAPVSLAGTDAGTLGQLELEHFTPERVTGHIDAGEPTFLYFTADWCVSCKVNERVALATDAVGEAFNERGIKVVEGDWTSEDPLITEWLGRYGRVGVPLYLYFPEGSSLDSPTILPQILLPEIVINAIAAADANV